MGATAPSARKGRQLGATAPVRSRGRKNSSTPLPVPDAEQGGISSGILEYGPGGSQVGALWGVTAQATLPKSMEPYISDLLTGTGYLERSVRWVGCPWWATRYVFLVGAPGAGVPGKFSWSRFSSRICFPELCDSQTLIVRDPSSVCCVHTVDDHNRQSGDEGAGKTNPPRPGQTPDGAS